MVERERESTCTISMLSLNLWCMLSVKILINVIDTKDAKLQSMSSLFPYSNMILTSHKPRNFFLSTIYFFKNYLVHLFITECKEQPTLPQPPISSPPPPHTHTSSISMWQLKCELCNIVQPDNQLFYFAVFFIHICNYTTKFFWSEM